MVTSSGVRLAGGYEDSLGSLLIFMMQKQGSAAPAAAEPAEQSTMQTSGTVETAPAAVPGSSAQQGNCWFLLLSGDCKCITIFMQY